MNATGWPPGMLQDDCRSLSRWLANKPDARHVFRKNLAMKIKPSELGEGIFIFSARKTIQISLQANSLLDAELAVAEIQEDQSLWDVEPEFSLLSWGKSI